MTISKYLKLTVVLVACAGSLVASNGTGNSQVRKTESMNVFSAPASKVRKTASMNVFSAPVSNARFVSGSLDIGVNSMPDGTFFVTLSDGTRTIFQVSTKNVNIVNRQDQEARING